MKRIPLLSAVTALLLSTACSNTEQAAEPTWDELGDLGTLKQEARVTAEQAGLALALAESTREYIPYEYTPDGCYARALYMSMELATRFVPSSAQYLNGTLRPNASVTWGWHVAPMVEIIGAEGRMVLDPALSPTRPVTLVEWVDLSNPIGSYELEWTLGSQYFTDNSARRNVEQTPVIQSFDELPPFKLSDISQACGTMHSYMQLEGKPAAVRDEKRERLVLRTRQLVDRLWAIGKLDESPEGITDLCGWNMQVPACFDDGAACKTDADCCSESCDAGKCASRPVDEIETAEPIVIGENPDLEPFVPGDIEDEGALTLATPSAPVSGGLHDGHRFQFEVPTGATSLKVQMKGQRGDADLHLRAGAPATTTDFDHRPLVRGNSETVEIESPTPGTWHVLVYGYGTYTGVTVQADVVR